MSFSFCKSNSKIQIHEIFTTNAYKTREISNSRSQQEKQQKMQWEPTPGKTKNVDDFFHHSKIDDNL